MRVGRGAAWGGVAGPLVFTAAWVASSLRQGQSATRVQLSGLAAEVLMAARMPALPPQPSTHGGI